ncbi:MAG TPA: carboxypeptidase regulatory-like domain-containing protein [Acidimicrobiales bacterium]|nr:carboxypeptidase regulatory-like domain-containing protein [Acidimicrobiales bacterium]
MVVAITLLVISLFAAAQVLTSGMRVSGDTRARVVASNLATQTIEGLRASAVDPTKFSNIPVGTTVLASQKISGTTFTVTQEARWVGQRSSVSNCETGGDTTQILRVTAVVTWPNMNGTKPVQSSTTFSPPVGAYSASEGSIAAKVMNAAGQPVSTVTVSTTGGTVTTPVVTGTDGCAFFQSLAPGTYTVSVAKAGYVTDQPTSTQSVSVVAGQIAPLTFNFDQASTIGFTGFTGATPAAAGIKISVGNTSLQPYGLTTYNAGTTSLNNLFPFTTGYTVFAGSCTDSNPLGLNTGRQPFYPGATATPTAVTPGTTTAGVTAPLYALAISVVNQSGTAQANATASALASAPSNGGTCPAGTPSYTLTTTSSAAPIGQSTTGVPLGHFTITAFSSNGSKTGNVKVWVKPDGVWAVDASGNATTKYTGAVSITVK